MDFFVFCMQLSELNKVFFVILASPNFLLNASENKFRVLSLGKIQIYLVFRSLIRNFAR